MMANEVIELKPKSEGNFPVTKEAVEALKNQRDLLREFVKSQLRENVDFGVIPGTDKPSLFKPGAEKLARLFQLGVRLERVDRDLDREGNFAFFSYRAEVYPLHNSDLIIAECEGSCNSQEKKYRERSVWVKLPNQANKVRQTEVTPICDVLNTLSKMAQKRAFVGAVILATGASDFFTQDIDDPEDAAQLGVGPKEAPTPTPVQTGIPNVTQASSQNQAQPSGTGKFCELCKAELRLSQRGDAYTCPNWKDQSKGRHSYVPV